MRIAPGLLAIVALACLIALQSPSTTRYVIGTPSEGWVSYGFWPIESNAEGSFRWSDGDSRLRFFGYERATRLELALRMIGPYGPRQEETRMSLRVGGTTLAEATTPRLWRTYRLLVPSSGGGWQTPEILVAGTLTSQMAFDEHPVGVAISAVEVRALDGPRALAVAEYAASLALLLALIWFGLSRALRPLPALGLALAGGLLLLAWSRLSPVGMAYLLPPLWGALLPPAGGIALLWLAERLAPQLRGSGGWLLAGLGLGLSGTLLLRARIGVPLGGGLLLGGAVLATAALLGLAPSAPGPRSHAGRGGERSPLLPRGEGGIWYSLALLGCLGLGLGLRVVDLDHIPFGMWRDEARHGLIALGILNNPGYRPIYVPEADIPALLFYLQSLSIAALGPTLTAVRLVPALAGGLTGLVLAFAAGQIWGRAAGVAAALLLAASAWHIALSRLAFAAVLDPLLSLTALGLLWRICAGRGASWRRLVEGLGAGVALGLALYSYHPARLMPLAALLWVALRLGRNWPAWRQALPALAACGLAAVIVAGPLLGYWLSQTSKFNQRVGQVGLLDHLDEAERSLSSDLASNVARYTLMWHVEGEQNPRHNIPGTPMLDPLSGLLFLIGLLLLLNERRLEVSLPLLALLGVGLLPGLLSSDAPHAVRTVDAIAPAILIAAYATSRIATALADQPLTLRLGMITTSVVFIVSINAWSYLGRVPYDPRVWGAFTYTAETAIGQAIHADLCLGPAFVPDEYATSETLSYLATGHAVVPFTISALPERFPAGSCVFVPAKVAAADRAQIERASAGADAAQVPARYPGSDQPVFWMYRVP